MLNMAEIEIILLAFVAIAFASGGNAAASTKEAGHAGHEYGNFIELSYPLDNNTLHWPANDGFNYTVAIDDERKDQYGQSHYVKSDNIHMAIHSGTHLDAPVHFSRTGLTVDKIPLNKLIRVPVKVIDLSEKVKANKSYSFTIEDFQDSKINASLVQEKSVVLVYTGVSDSYSGGNKSYFGTDSKNIEEMKIPGFSKEAAMHLVARNVYGVGLDAPSVDSSTRHAANGVMDPVAHVTFAKANIYMIENINTKLAEVLHMQQNGHEMRLTILPLPIVSASGSPIRLLAEPLSNIAREAIKAPTNSASSYLPRMREIVLIACFAVAFTMNQRFG